MSDELLIEIEGLSKSYSRGLFSSSFPALREVSLSVGRGSVFGLLGPNGAGKTTMLKCLLGLVRPTSGKARLFGEPVGTTASRERIGYLPEAHRMPTYLTGRQVLSMYGMYSGRSKAWIAERADSWLERVGMSSAANDKIKTYSKGMMQRVGLAQAFIHEPDLVFLDEPTDGIDPVGRAKIREIVAQEKERGTTIFVNSHLLMEVEQVCDRAVILANGRIVRSGTMEELTPDTGRTTFFVADNEADIATLLRGIGEKFEADDKSFSIEVDQSQQDKVVDTLRSANISIRKIEQRKLTLEETFIDLVQEDRA